MQGLVWKYLQKLSCSGVGKSETKLTYVHPIDSNINLMPLINYSVAYICCRICIYMYMYVDIFMCTCTYYAVYMPYFDRHLYSGLHEIFTEGNYVCCILEILYV